MKEIHIVPVLNGFIVEVGCQRLVFDNIGLLCVELKRYQRDPEAMEKEYMANAINRPGLRVEEPRRTEPVHTDMETPNPTR